MKKTYVIRLILPLVILALGALWWFAPIKVQLKPTTASRQDSPETILNHVKASQSPLVLINFWASWCEPCKEELPAIKTLNEKYSGQGLEVILVSIDDPDEIEAAVQFLADNQLNFKTFYKGAQSLRFVSQIYPKWSGAVPATLLMNSELKILDAWEGDTPLEELEIRVKRQLKGS